MKSIPGFDQNKLLETLSPDESARILKNMDLVQMHAGEVLYESGEKIQVAYFPIDCFISLLYETEDGSTTQIACIGNDGAVGVAMVISDESMPHTAMVQNTGWAYRLGRPLLLEEFNPHGAFYHKLLSLTQLLMTQIAFTSASVLTKTEK